MELYLNTDFGTLHIEYDGGELDGLRTKMKGNDDVNIV